MSISAWHSYQWRLPGNWDRIPLPELTKRQVRLVGFNRGPTKVVTPLVHMIHTVNSHACVGRWTHHRNIRVKFITRYRTACIPHSGSPLEIIAIIRISAATFVFHLDHYCVWVWNVKFFWNSRVYRFLGRDFWSVSVFT